MIFEEDKSSEKLGERIGYIFSYFAFTTILFLIMILLKKIPKNWTYLHMMVIVLAIAFIGALLKRTLK